MNTEDAQKLAEFMASGRLNTDLEVNNMRVWVRNIERDILDREVYCFDIVNPRMAEEHRGKGYFTDLLNIAEASGRNIYVQDVATERMRDFLSRRGYAEIKDVHHEGWPSAYFKPFEAR